MSPQQKLALRKALLDAFDDHELDMLVNDYLNEDLKHIISDRPGLKVVVHQLIKFPACRHLVGITDQAVSRSELDPPDHDQFVVRIESAQL